MSTALRLLRLTVFIALAAFLLLAWLLQGPSRPAMATAFPDDDGDGIPNLGEIIGGSDPNDPNSTTEDTGSDSILGTSQCSDGVDNDLDGLVDADDSGCVDSDGDIVSDAMETLLGSDPSDSGSFPESALLDGVLVFAGFNFLFCADGIDNDLDGVTDGDDPGCDPIDTDGDGFEEALEKRFGSDPADPNSVPEHEIPNPGSCSDGIDNDLDGTTDGADLGCQVAENDDFADATVITSLPFTDSAKIVESATELGEPSPSCAFGSIANSVWYSLTPSADTLLAADTTGSEFDTVLAVWKTQGVFGLGEVACVSVFGFPSGSSLAFEAVAGETYYFQVAGTSFDTQAGKVAFNLDVGFRPANDDFTDATVITSLPFADSVDTLLASTEPDEPGASCTFGEQPASTVWFSFTPTQDTLLLIDTAGSDFNAILAVWTDTVFGLGEIACGAVFGPSPGSRLAFQAEAGQTYVFQVGGFPFGGGAAGKLAFSLDVGIPPANDDFAGAVITSLPFSDSVDTTTASIEPDEPAPSCAFGDPASTVWYNFAPDTDTILLADTTGSEFGTFIAAYQGASLVDLTEVACATPFFPGNQLSFEAIGGQTYLFQVGGFSFGPIFFENEFPQAGHGGGPPVSFGNLVFNLDAISVPPCPTTQFSVEDPVGDTLSFGIFGPPPAISPPHDIISVSGGADDENFCLTVALANPIDPPDADSDRAIFAVVEFDTDENPDTGFRGELNFVCPDPAGLGVEAQVNMFGGGPLVPIFQPFGPFSGEDFAIALFDETSFSLIIPLSALGGDDSFDFALYVGSPFAGATDCAPNGGSIHSPTPLPPPPPPPNPPAIPGDVDCDGSVTIADAQLIAQLVVGLAQLACPDNADVDESGSVTITDAQLIAQLVAGRIDSLPSS